MIKKPNDIHRIPKYYDFDWVLKEAYSREQKDALLKLRIGLLIGTTLLYVFAQMHQPFQDWLLRHGSVEPILFAVNLSLFVYAGVTLYLKIEFSDDKLARLLLWIPTDKNISDERKKELSRAFLKQDYKTIKKERTEWMHSKLIVQSEMERLAAGSDVEHREFTYRSDTTDNLIDEHAVCVAYIGKLTTYMNQIKECYSAIPDPEPAHRDTQKH